MIGFAFAVCPKDGIWEVTQDGEEQVRLCQGDTVGQMTRRCRIVSENESVWDDPDYQYCLSKHPPKGMSYVDFAYIVPHSKTVMIRNNRQGVVQALCSIYDLPVDHVSVYRVARWGTHVSLLL